MLGVKGNTVLTWVCLHEDKNKKEKTHEDTNKILFKAHLKIPSDHTFRDSEAFAPKKKG
jgi:hypothetical protein